VLVEALVRPVVVEVALVFADLVAFNAAGLAHALSSSAVRRDPLRRWSAGRNHRWTDTPVRIACPAAT
jgi:hypothetical protein